MERFWKYVGGVHTTLRTYLMPLDSTLKWLRWQMSCYACFSTLRKRWEVQVLWRLGKERGHQQGGGRERENRTRGPGQCSQGRGAEGGRCRGSAAPHPRHARIPARLCSAPAQARDFHKAVSVLSSLQGHRATWHLCPVLGTFISHFQPRRKFLPDTLVQAKRLPARHMAGTRWARTGFSLRIKYSQCFFRTRLGGK